MQSDRGSNGPPRRDKRIVLYSKAMSVNAEFPSRATKRRLDQLWTKMLRIFSIIVLIPAFAYLLTTLFYWEELHSQCLVSSPLFIATAWLVARTTRGCLTNAWKSFRWQPASAASVPIFIMAIFDEFDAGVSSHYNQTYCIVWPGKIVAWALGLIPIFTDVTNTHLFGSELLKSSFVIVISTAIWSSAAGFVFGNFEDDTKLKTYFCRPRRGLGGPTSSSPAAWAGCCSRFLWWRRHAPSHPVQSRRSRGRR